ncbi:substrate-binding domain-containing protein [Micromonospora sp. NPDC093277]|uniref:substrate-binding domain-containing protein n=1 Tax=Micromonospora sp. NPDC093277 TaxID=3364291 RepID=UPI003800CF13
MRSVIRTAGLVVAGSAALLMTVTGTAYADSPGTPAASDVVGVGSDTTEFVTAKLAADYNAKSPAPTNKLFSYDATGSSTIPLKPGCTAITRPNGSSAGITALQADTTHCIDFARSSRPKKTDGTESNLTFREFARDGLGVAVKASGSSVPATLTTLDLFNLYGAAAGTPACNRTAYLPQPGSGTRSVFLANIGLTETTKGSCAKDTWDNDSNPATPEVGVQEHDPAPIANNANAVAPFSAGRKGAFTSVVFRNLDDSVRPSGLAANSTVKVDPVTGQVSTAGTAVNVYDRALYNVFRVADLATGSTYKARLDAAFGPLGWICTNATAKADIEAAGFRRSSNCGS